MRFFDQGCIGLHFAWTDPPRLTRFVGWRFSNTASVAMLWHLHWRFRGISYVARRTSGACISAASRKLSYELFAMSHKVYAPALEVELSQKVYGVEIRVKIHILFRQSLIGEI